jgi:diaminopimelate decarboxylase
MSFHYVHDHLHVEGVPLSHIVQHYGTPCYVYSYAALAKQWQAFQNTLISYPHQICYSVKANSNLALLALLAQWGAGFDVVSAGELARVIKAGGHAKKSVFSGVGKTTQEIQYALQMGIGCFNIESRAELLRIAEEAQHLNLIAPIAVRINPDIDANTHPYITTGLKETKFGISEDCALTDYHLAASLPAIKITGIACHLGSQLTTLHPFLQAMDHLLTLSEQLRKEHINLQTINLGGGLGIAYHQEIVPTPQDYCKAILKKLIEKNNQLRLIIEPGRALIAPAGILVTRVEYIKHNTTKNFAIVDAGMNDLLRPALYHAEQAIQALDLHPERHEILYDVVGPVCESSDFLGKARKLRILAGDYLVIRDCGAYGFSMSSNYNSRPRAAEIMVNKDKVILIRSRETLEHLWANELIPPCLLQQRDSLT